jgi:hypothetical protein
MGWKPYQMSKQQQFTDMDVRKKGAKRTAAIVGAVAIAIFLLSILQMLKIQ